MKIGNNSIYLGGSNQNTNTNNTIYATGDLYLQSDTANSFNTIMNHNNSGNVGIGVSTPGYKLDVAGTIRSCRVLVEDVNGWCDYVFDEGYNLLPLDSLAHYIQENGHLPEVPSEEEVEANGVDLVETQKVLLKKIEELTLYVIELKNENELLQAEVEELKVSER